MTKSNPNLPRLQHTIKLTEELKEIVLDITDETGGLGIKLYLSAATAYKLGERMMERARVSINRDKDDPQRVGIEEFITTAE